MPKRKKQPSSQRLSKKTIDQLRVNLDQLRVNLSKRIEQDNQDNEALAFMAGQAFNVVSRFIEAEMDSYATFLEKKESQIGEHGSANGLTSLHKLQIVHRRALQYPDDIHPLDAHCAIELAGELNVPAPQWAASILKVVREKKAQNRRVDLDKELGFTGKGSGTTSEAERRIRENIKDQSRLRIWGLTLLGEKIGRACWLEAGRMQRSAGWNTTDYDIEPDLASKLSDPAKRAQQLHDKRLAFTEQLRQDFFGWRTEIEKDPSSEFSQYYRQCLEQNRDRFLAQFPTD